MALTEQEKIETRHHCGYPAYGGNPSGFGGWQFYQAYGLMEFRITNLAEGEIIVLRRHLATLRNLESAIPRAAENLDTNQAAVWTRNHNEIRDRERLYDGWRARLCSFLGLPLGPGLKSSNTNLIV